MAIRWVSSESGSLSQHPELLKLAIFLFLGNAAGYTEWVRVYGLVQISVHLDSL